MVYNPSEVPQGTDCSLVPYIFNITALLLSDYGVQVRKTELVVYIISTSLIFLSITITAFYMKFRIHEYDRLKARSFPLVVAGHLGAIVQLQTGCLTKILLAQVPCNWNSIFSLMVVPLILLPLSVKLIQLRKQDLLTRAAARAVELDDGGEKSTRGDPDMDGPESNTSVRTSDRVSRLLSQSKRLMVLILGGDPDSKRFSKHHTIVTTIAVDSATAPTTSLNQTTTLMPSHLLQPEENSLHIITSGPSIREILWLRYSAGSWGAVLTLAVVNAPFFFVALLAFAFVHPIYTTSCLGCGLSLTHAYFIASEGALAVTLMVFLMRTTKIKSDPFGIKQEIWLVIAVGAIPSLIAFILTFTATPTVPGFSFNTMVTLFLLLGSLCQGWLQVILAKRDAVEIRQLHGIGVEVEEEKAGLKGDAEGEDLETQEEEEKRDRVESLVKVVRDGESNHRASSSHQQQPLQSQPQRISVGINYAGLLQLVLGDPVFRNAFHAHLCDEHNVEPLTFIDAVDRWRFHFGSSSPETSHRRAKRIMKNFVGPRAPFPIPLPSSQVDAMIRKTVKPESLTIDAFDGARGEMMRVLEYGPLVRFTKSNIWKGFVDDGLIADNDHLLLPQRTLTRNSSAAIQGSPRPQASSISDTAVAPSSSPLAFIKAIGGGSLA